MCCFSELFVSSEIFITDKTYKCFLVMNFPFVLFHTAFKIEFIITVVLNMKPNIFFVSAEKLHFLQFLTNTSAIIFCRTLMMATCWTFNFDISLFLAGNLCIKFISFLKFCYLSTMVASFVLISL